MHWGELHIGYMKMNEDLIGLAASVGHKLMKKNWQIATAESCTGGGIAAAITAIPGSSAWFGYGVVSYSNEAKHKLLGVDLNTIERFGAVSEEVVRSMSHALLTLSGADISIAVSGVAGPGGGSLEKPVGGVWFAWATKKTAKVDYIQLGGDRQAVQRQAVARALIGVLEVLELEDQKNTV